MKKNSKKVGTGMQSRWEATCEGIRNGAEKLTFGFAKSSCPGIYAVEAKADLGIFPYGWIWFRHETGHVVSIMECFVPEYLRRCGIMTAMFKQLLEWFPETRMVVTGRATQYSAPWLTKQGFTFNQAFDRWELILPLT